MKATAFFLGVGVAWCMLLGSVHGQAGDTPRLGLPLSLPKFPTLGGDKTPKQDPFAAQRGQETAAAPAATGGEYPQTQYTAGPNKNQADGATLLFEARRLLAKGDVIAATAAVSQARASGAQFNATDDTPEKIEALIGKTKEFAAGPRGADTNAFLGQYAQHMLDQAEGLVRYSDFDSAQRLAEQVRQMGATYRQFERTPDSVLKLIQTQRAAKAGGLSTGDNPASVAAAPTAPARLPETAGTVRSGGGKAEAAKLLAIGRAALDRGEVEQAERYVRQAESLNVPDSAFAQGETRPWELLLEIARQRNRRDFSPTAGAGNNVAPAVAQGNFDNRVDRGVYRPGADGSRVMRASDEQPVDAGAAAPSAAPNATSGAPVSDGHRLYDDGMKALERQDRDAAAQLFRQAWKFEAELDPFTRQKLQDNLSRLSTPVAAPAALPPGGVAAQLPPAEGQPSVAQRQLMSEIMAEQASAERQRATDPRGALARLEQLRERVAKTELDAAGKKRLLTLVDRAVSDANRYIESNRSQIELNEQNAKVMDDLEQSRNVKVEVDGKLGELVGQFNTLMDQKRFPEAQVIAKQARELDGENPVVQTMIWKVSFAMHLYNQLSVRDDAHDNFAIAMNNVDSSKIPFDDNRPLQFGAPKEWSDVTSRREKWMQKQETRYSESEMAILKSLNTMVDVKFTDKPLAEVIETLGRMAGVNVYIDPQGLAAEGITSETPVRFNLNQPITLKSALNNILEPVGLGYVVQDEVLRITSQSTRNAQVYTKVYNVADLVIPIPNFVPSYNLGLPGAIRESMAMAGYGGAGGGFGAQPLTVLADNKTPANTNPSVVAQALGAGGQGGLGSLRGNNGQRSLGAGPGGLGGGVQADFDTLIELITTTVAPDTWDAVGGKGAVQGFDTNLSLVVSQTQEVHEEIADLLEQLRRLQDLQVTLEVRFITLNDSFFERIGIDFDFNIDDNTPANVNPAQLDDSGPSVTIGLDPSGNPTANLDLQFRNNSFGDAVPPQLPGLAPFTPASAASFGFAILSDIEVFFLLSAAQGDTRTNVMQSPKVTLFNGQQAVVSDTSQRPFVTTVIPVVGDFAAAQQPVVVVLSEGTSLSVQAVVSNDRRFVRLTLVPFFSTIGDVQEFTFSGSRSTNTGVDNANNPNNDNAVTTVEGTTVQLPTFNFTTVTTTVSVPDGGTVLLGGVKRMAEGRNERGVPMLSKVPYVSRLFRNVGIARTSSSLMLMVTPRIIIQEEEEDKLGLQDRN